MAVVNSKTLKFVSIPSSERVLSRDERKEMADLAWSLLLNEEYILPFTAKILDRVRRKTAGENYVKFRRQWIFRIALQQVYKSAISGEFDLNIKPERENEITSENLFAKPLFQLPIETRLIFILKKRFSFTNEDIGDILELSEGTISYRIEKAENFLGKKLKSLDFLKLTADSILNEVINELDEKAIRNIARENVYREKELPGFLKLAIEGAFITFVIVVLIGVIPRGKFFYEKWTSGRLDFYGTFSNPISPVEKNAGIAPNELENFLSEDEASKVVLLEADKTKEVSAGKADEISSNIDKNLPEYKKTSEYEEEKEHFARYNTGRGRVYRIYLKSPNPIEVKPQVLDILKDAGGTAAGSVELGQEMLGGIYFNFYVKKENVEELKKELKAKYKVNTYLNYSKQRIPRGHSNVVIWIQQI